ncbi:hypothetical protein OnM2_046045 [Erysiphe neolycopersici]|uniref:Uncharacterized protein n=1 Tax=Erysiphe neolycopersici TaxID=212602 RepID=A0A420HTW7_9PEZI|nr:hypothetical protein OnM2_046045 [Erysiphe neolycopersici]
MSELEKSHARLCKTFIVHRKLIAVENIQSGNGTSVSCE